MRSTQTCGMARIEIGRGLKTGPTETCENVKGIDHNKGKFLTNQGMKLRQCTNLCYTMSVILNQCLNRPKIRRVTWKKEELVGQIERCFAFWD